MNLPIHQGYKFGQAKAFVNAANGDDYQKKVQLLKTTIDNNGLHTYDMSSKSGMRMFVGNSTGSGLKTRIKIQATYYEEGVENTGKRENNNVPNPTDRVITCPETRNDEIQAVQTLLDALA